jgi:tetratricopeptide (TPR) repeat protein
MNRFFDEPSEIIQSRKMLGFGQSEEALLLLSNGVVNHLSDVSPSYKALLLSEQALVLLTEFDKTKEALILIDQAYDQTHKKDIYAIKIYIAHAEILLTTNNHSEGLEIANSIIELSEKLNFSEEQAIGEYLIAFGNYLRGNIHIALEFSHIALEKLKNSENYLYYAKSLIINGYCLKILGDLIKSLQILEKAESIAKSQNFNHNLLPVILQVIGELKLNLGEYKDAERYIKNCQSLTVFSTNSRNKNIFYRCISDLADLYYLQGDNQKAVTELKTNYHEIQKDDLEGKLYLLSSLGKLYKRNGGLQEARIYFEEAINVLQLILHQLSFSDTHASVLINYAQTLILLKDLEQAFEVILKVKSMIAVQGSQSLIPKTLSTEGMYYSSIKQYELAKTIFLKALEQSKYQNNYFDIIESYLFIAEVNLEIYKEEKLDRYFFDAKDSINKAYDLALKQKIIPTINKIRILKAVLYASELNFGLALDLLNQAKSDSEHKMLNWDLENITRLILKIHSQLPQISLEPDVNSIISLISRFTDSSTFHKIAKSEINLVCFKFTEKGPVPFYYSENLTRDENVNMNVITTIGVLLISVIGQGNAYFEGLFGPIPLKQLPDKLILCYTGMVEDDNLVDERLNNFNYFLLALIFPKMADDMLLFNRKTIQIIFEQFVLLNKNINSWNEKNLNTLHTNLISTFDTIEEVY